MGEIVINEVTYRTVRQLGKGAFGVVHLANRVLDNVQVAIKIMQISREREKLINYEVKVLEWLTRKLGPNSPFNQLIDHQIIGQDSPWSSREHVIVLEYIEGETLGQFLSKFGGEQKMGVIKNLLGQLLLAINILHSLNVVHRDLKGDNIMVKTTDDGPGYQLIIIDFGLSCNRSITFMKNADEITRKISEECHTRKAGTPAYMSPQLWERTERRRLSFQDLKKVDVWAIGVILFKMIYNLPPFEGKYVDEFTRALTIYRNPDSSFRRRLQDEPTEFNDIIKAIFVDINSRPTIYQLVGQFGGTIESTTFTFIPTCPTPMGFRYATTSANRTT